MEVCPRQSPNLAFKEPQHFPTVIPRHEASSRRASTPAHTAVNDRGSTRRLTPTRSHRFGSASVAGADLRVCPRHDLRPLSKSLPISHLIHREFSNQAATLVNVFEILEPVQSPGGFHVHRQFSPGAVAYPARLPFILRRRGGPHRDTAAVLTLHEQRAKRHEWLDLPGPKHRSRNRGYLRSDDLRRHDPDLFRNWRKRLDRGTVTIDGAAYECAGMRLKGNSSLGGLRPANGENGPRTQTAIVVDGTPFAIDPDSAEFPEMDGATVEETNRVGFQAGDPHGGCRLSCTATAIEHNDRRFRSDGRQPQNRVNLSVFKTLYCDALLHSNMSDVERGLVPAQLFKREADRDRICRREALRRHADPGNIGLVLFDISRNQVRGRSG